MRIDQTNAVFVLAACGLVLTGCPPPAVYQTADPAAPGDWQVGGGLGAVHLTDVEQDVDTLGADVEVFARHGVVPDLDVGLRLYSIGMEGSLKWRFWQGDWSLALMPGLAVSHTRQNNLTTEAWHAFATLPLLASRRLSEHWRLSTGPKLVSGFYRSKDGASDFGLSLGGYVMGCAHLSDFRLMPEVGLSRSVAGAVPVHGWTVNLGLGFAWQRDDSLRSLGNEGGG